MTKRIGEDPTGGNFAANQRRAKKRRRIVHADDCWDPNCGPDGPCDPSAKGAGGNSQ